MVAVLVFALLALAPAAALAAGETSGTATSESPTTSTEPASPSAGWSAQEPAPGTSGGGGSLQHGSSVGSGAVEEQPQPSGEEPSQPPVSQESSSVGGSGGEYRPEVTTAPAPEPASAAPVAGGSGPVPSPAPKAAAGERAKVGLGGASPVTLPVSSPHRNVATPAPAPAASLAAQGGQTSSGSNLLRWLAVIVGCLLLARIGAVLWGYRQRRQEQLIGRRRSAEWEAVLQQIARERKAPVVAHPTANRLQRIEREDEVRAAG